MTPNQGRSPGPDDAAADVIRRLRQRHGLSQRQVSEMLGVGLRTLQRWESGDQVPPAYLARALRDLSRELSRDDEGSIANLIDEYAYVRLIARLAHRARTRAAPESPPDPPQRILLAELPSGVHTPCLLHSDDLVELGRAAATLEVGDDVRVGARVARISHLVPPIRPARAQGGFAEPGLFFRVTWRFEDSDAAE